MNQVPFLSRSFVVAALLAMMAPWGAAIASPGNLSDNTGGNVSDITGGNISDITGGNLSDNTGGSPGNQATAQYRADLAERLGEAYDTCAAGGSCAQFYALFDEAFRLGL